MRNAVVRLSKRAGATRKRPGGAAAAAVDAAVAAAAAEMATVAAMAALAAEADRRPHVLLRRECPLSNFDAALCAYHLF